MKTLPVLLAGALALSSCATPVAPSAQTPAPAVTRAAVLDVMERAADWQIAHPAPRWKPVDWHNAAFYAGVMALSRVSDSPRFESAMMKMGELNRWKPGVRPYHADDHAVAQTYIELYAKHRDERMIAPTKAAFDFILAHPKDNNLNFNARENPDRLDRWSWCDALFMAPPAWVGLWKVTGNAAYLDFAVTHWWITSDYLYDKDEHLYYRDSSYFDKREPNGKKIFWGRGNGWVMGGLARVLAQLPADHPSRPRFEQQFRDMAAAVLACQQPDGMWRASLLDAGAFPMEETSGTGFFCFAFAWGVNHGLLDRATYEPAALKAWASIARFVKPDGKLTHVQPVGSTPVTFDPDSTEPYGVGALLLAGSEVIRLASQK